MTDPNNREILNQAAQTPDIFSRQDRERLGMGFKERVKNAAGRAREWAGKVGKQAVEVIAATGGNPLNLLLMVSSGEIDTSLQGVDDVQAKTARHLRNAYNTASASGKTKEAERAIGELAELVDENPRLQEFFDLTMEEVRGEVKPGEESRLGERRAIVPRERGEETESREIAELEEISERNLVNVRRLDPNSAKQILIAVELGLYGIAGKGLDIVSEKSLLKPARIEGREVHDKQELINRCVEVIDRRNNMEDQEFLRDLHMAQSIDRFYHGPHEAIKTAVDGAQVEQTMNTYVDQGAFPTTQEGKPGSYQDWIRYFLEKGNPKWKQFLEVYHDRKIDFDEIRKSENPRELLNDYFASIDAEGITIDQDVRDEIYGLFAKGDSLEDLQQRAKLDRIMRLREIWYVPYATNRKDKNGKRKPDLYPTEKLANSDDLDFIDVNPSQHPRTHVATRTVGINGFLTGIEDFLMNNSDIQGWYYHSVRYAVVTRIRCMTILGMKLYNRKLGKTRDVEGFEGRGADLSSKEVMEYSGSPLRGDWFGYLENRTAYTRANLERRNFTEKRIRELEGCPGRDGVIRTLAQAVTEREILPLTGREYSEWGGRTEKGVNHTNEAIAKKYYGARYYQIIFDMIGAPDASWRSIWVNERQLTPEEEARYYLLHLHQGFEYDELGRPVRKPDVVDKDMVYYLFHLCPEFEKDWLIRNRDTDEVVGKLDEAVFLEKILNHARSWQKDKQDNLVARCIDNPNALMETAISEMEEARQLTETEKWYLRDPEYYLRICAKERAVRHYQEWDKDHCFDYLYILSTKRKAKGVLLYDEKTHDPYTIDPDEVQGKINKNKQIMELLNKTKTGEPLTPSETNTLQYLNDAFTVAQLQRFTENFGITEREQQFLEMVRKGEPYEAIDENMLLEKIRANRTAGRADFATIDEISFSRSERDYFNIFNNRMRLEALNRIERQRMRQEINGARARRGTGDFSAEDQKLLEQIETVQDLSARADLGQTRRFSTEEREMWENRHQLEYYTIPPESLSVYEQRDVREMADLLTWFNWGEIRRVYNLDYPWLDLQQRQFFAYALDFAILNKLGFFGHENAKTGKLEHPMQGFDPATIREKMLFEKRKLTYRFGNGLDEDDELEGQPITGRPVGEVGGEVRGDPVMFFEEGDGNYSDAWFQQHGGRYDPPLTIAAHNKVVQLMDFRMNSAWRVLRAKGKLQDPKDIRAQVMDPWSLFATPSMEVNVLGGFNVAKNERGFYYTLSLMGPSFLSPWMLHHVAMNEGRFAYKMAPIPGRRIIEPIFKAVHNMPGKNAIEAVIKAMPVLGQLYILGNVTEPEMWREGNWNLGIEDVTTGKTGGEETIGRLVEVSTNILPGIEVGKLIPKGFNFVTGPRVRTIQYVTIAGITLGIPLGPGGMAAGAITGFLGGFAIMGLSSVIGVYDRIKDWAIDNGIRFDYAGKPEEIAQAFVKQTSERELVPK